jgi:cbb3-type cytochrome oxidase subunit 3
MTMTQTLVFCGALGTIEGVLLAADQHALFVLVLIVFGCIWLGLRKANQKARANAVLARLYPDDESKRF